MTALPVRAGTAGAVLAAICCATPFLPGVLPLAGLGEWLAGAGLVLPLVIACFGLVAWAIHRSRARPAAATPIFTTKA